jgi:HK97 family phage portal protein
MASIWQRLTGRVETRAVQPTIPSRSATLVTADSALTLSAVYRAVNIIATTVSSLRLETFRYAGGMEQKIPNPLLVNNPSLEDSRRDFLFMTAVSLLLDGNAFWLKTPDTRGGTNNLTILPPNAVGIRLDGANGLTGRKVYDYLGETYTADRIQHLKAFSRAGVLRGISPIQSASKDIASIIDLRDFAANWFSSGGVPTGVLKTSLQLSKDDADAMTATWHNKQQNRQIAVLGSGFEYQAVALSPRDALFTEVQSQAVQQIARLFGIPARMLLTGIDGSSDTYTNMVDELQVFYKTTLMGYLNTIEDGLSACLPRGTATRFVFEDLFRADPAARIQMFADAIAAGIMTVEEVRMKEGLDA